MNNLEAEISDPDGQLSQICILLLKSTLFVTSQLSFVNPQNIYPAVNISNVWQTQAA